MKSSHLSIGSRISPGPLLGCISCLPFCVSWLCKLFSCIMPASSSHSSGAGPQGELFESVTSLGSLCTAARWIEEEGLRTGSNPLDWIYSSPAMVRHCLKDDSKAFLDRSKYRKARHYVGHSVYSDLQLSRTRRTVFIHSFIHPFAHSFSNSVIQSLIQPFSRSVTQLLSHSFTNSFTHSLIPFIHPFIHSLIHLFIHSFIHASIYLLIQPFSHSVIHSFIHSLILNSFHSSFILVQYWLRFRYPLASCFYRFDSH